MAHCWASPERIQSNHNLLLSDVTVTIDKLLLIFCYRIHSFFLIFPLTLFTVSCKLPANRSTPQLHHIPSLWSSQPPSRETRSPPPYLVDPKIYDYFKKCPSSRDGFWAPATKSGLFTR